MSAPSLPRATAPLQSGGRIPGSDDAAFGLMVGETATVPIVIGAPHGGRSYPDAVVQSMREPDRAKLKLEDRLIDIMAQEVAQATGAPLIMAHAPRAMIDLNRSPDDIDWSMIRGRTVPNHPTGAVNRRARTGLGLVPRRLPGMGEIWKGRLERAELDERIDSIHKPYHAALGLLLERVRDEWGAVLLIDLHSMPPLKSDGPGEPAAEFVVGDRFGSSCGDGLAAAALTFLSAAERRVAHNRPYSGGYVLDRHGAPRRGIHAMQLEICRSTYLDAQMREAGPRFMGVARLLGQMVRALAAQVANTSSGDIFRHAAE